MTAPAKLALQIQDFWCKVRTSLTRSVIMKSLKNLLILLLLSLPVQSEEAADIAAIEAKLRQAGPTLPIKKIEPIEIEGYYAVYMPDGSIIYMDADAEHFFYGELFLIRGSTFVNATQRALSDERRLLLAGLDESEMLVFSPAPEKVKATITVFTDIDCGYCRKLHREVPELNKLGVAVRYLAYPRAGVGSASFDKAVSAWCAANPNTALTRAKAGEEIEQLTCANPVAAHYALGDQFGVTGTPAIFFEDGRLQPGYLPAQEMARRLGIN